MIGITLGVPQFKLGYKIKIIRAIGPTGEIFVFKNDEERYTDLYTAHLEMIGVERIRELIEEKAEGKDKVILLCFCDLTKRFCHRRIFAKWWYERTGEFVAEWGTSEKINKKRQMTLF